jgi:hypothetical protein
MSYCWYLFDGHIRSIFITIGNQEQSQSGPVPNANITSTGQKLYELFPDVDRETIERLYSGIGDDNNELTFFSEDNNSQLSQA